MGTHERASRPQVAPSVRGAHPPTAAPACGAAGYQDLQRLVGNRMAVAILRSPEMLQRVNTYYTDFPRKEDKENPLTTIAQSVGTNVDPAAQSALVAEWKKGNSLEVAASARPNVLKENPVVRPIESAAWLDQRPTTKKRPNVPWITTYGNLGAIEDQIMGDPVRSHNGGHLIAWEFLQDEADVKGNVAPQAEDSNKEFWRRTEHTIEDKIQNSDPDDRGVEVIVTTPYNKDTYSVTYEELRERNVIPPTVWARIQEEELEGQSIVLNQLVPDGYHIRLLSAVSPIEPHKARAKEKNVETFPLSDYSDAEANRVLKEPKAPMSILATNFNPTKVQQEPFSFAHQVFLNYRTTPAPEPTPAPVAADPMPVADATSPPVADPTAPAEGFLKTYQPMTVSVLQELQDWFGLKAREAEEALIGMFRQLFVMWEGLRPSERASGEGGTGTS